MIFCFIRCSAIIIIILRFLLRLFETLLLLELQQLRYLLFFELLLFFMQFCLFL